MEFISFGKLATVCMHLILLMILMKTQHVETSSTKQVTGRSTSLTMLSSLSSTAAAAIVTEATITATAIPTVATTTTTTTATSTATLATTTPTATAAATATTTVTASTTTPRVVISTVTNGSSLIYLTSQPPTVKTSIPSLLPTISNQAVTRNPSTSSQHKTTLNFYSTTPLPSKFSTTNAVLSETPQSKRSTTLVSHTTKFKHPITSLITTVISKVTRGRSSLQLLSDTTTSFQKGSTSVLTSLLTPTSTLVSTSTATSRSSSVSLDTTTSKQPEIRSTHLAPVLSTSNITKTANITKTFVTTTVWNISTEQSILDINVTGATSKESQKLTTEEQVATGICVPLFVLSILGLIYFFYKRKRQDQSIKFPEACNESSWSYANSAFSGGESGENKAAESN